MDEKLKEIAARYESLCADSVRPEVYSDPARLAANSRARKELAPVAAAWGELCGARAACREAEMILSSETEAELLDLAREELSAARAREESLEQKLRELLLPSDPDDHRSVVVEIRGGVGGEESALFAADLFRMYSMYAEQQGWRVELASWSDTTLGGVKECSFLVEGEDVYARLKFESGVHRVQRVPETETQGRIHTSTVTVAVLPKVEEVEFALDPSELQIDTFRSSGAGGQKVNKTESAIRVTHLPSGTVVECQDERSQYKNKARALSILASRLAQAERERQEAAIGAARRSMVGSGMRNERIRTYNFPQGRVTDHRIGLTLYKLEAVMNGELQELTEALAAAERAELLRGGETT